MPEHREKCSNRYSGGGSHLQHNTPRAVRCRSTGKMFQPLQRRLPSAGAGHCAFGLGPTAPPAVGSIEVRPGSLVVRQPKWQ